MIIYIEDLAGFIAKLRSKGWCELVPTETAWVFQKATKHNSMLCYVVWSAGLAVFMNVNSMEIA